MQRLCFGHIHRATQKIFQILSQMDQSQQALVCRQVDQEVKVTAVVFLSLGDGAINPQVGRAMAACDRKHFRPEVLQALADPGGGCAAHSPNPICLVCVGSVSPGWLFFGGRPRRLPALAAAPEAPAALLALAACFAPLLCSPSATSSP
jgi:hypothetical protein